MNRIDRYLVRHILTMSAIVALALVTIYTFTTFVAELGSTGKGDYGVKELAIYTVLNLPSGLRILLPIIAMLGTLMGLGNLAGQGEITAIRAAGVSNHRIGLAALFAGVVLGALGWWIGEYVAPEGRQSAERYKSQARYGVDSGQALKPVWLRDGNQIVNVRQLIAEDHIGAAMIYTLADDLRLKAMTSVEDGRYVDGHWVFTGVQRTEFGSQDARVSHYDRYDWDGGLQPEVLKLFVLEARALSTSGLLELIAYLDANQLDASEQRLMLWRKLVAPVTIMAMMFFAVPFVFGSLRNSGAGLRLMIGVLLGVAFYVTNEVTANFGLLYGWPPALAAGTPTLAIAALGWWRLGRVG